MGVQFDAISVRQVARMSSLVQMDANGCKGMQRDAQGCTGMQRDASGSNMFKQHEMVNFTSE